MQNLTSANAIRAAIERRGDSALRDLRADFPKLPPSDVLRVVESAPSRGRVSAVRDFGRFYLGDVTLSARRLGGDVRGAPV